MNRVINDYPYVLAHLLWEGTEHYDEQYARFYREAIKRSKYSILDNSCFELGQSIPGEVLAKIYADYLPSLLVLPDVMGDVDQTINLTKEFLDSINSSEIKYMAVLQGKTKEEYERCLQYYNAIDSIEVIGINYRDLADGTMRLSFLLEMHKQGKLKKSIHLLGCNNPIEFRQYLDTPFRGLIKSVDTSSPIIHGWNKNWYNKEQGIQHKPKELLAHNLDRQINIEEAMCIMHNVNLFREYVNG